jgi:hypothetical protein
MQYFNSISRQIDLPTKSFGELFGTSASKVTAHNAYDMTAEVAYPRRAWTSSGDGGARRCTAKCDRYIVTVVPNIFHWWRGGQVADQLSKMHLPVPHVTAAISKKKRLSHHIKRCVSSATQIAGYRYGQRIQNGTVSAQYSDTFSRPPSPTEWLYVWRHLL